MAADLPVAESDSADVEASVEAYSPGEVPVEVESGPELTPESELRVDPPVTELAAGQEVSADDLPVDRVEPPVEAESGPELTPEAEWRFEEAEAIAEVASPVEAEPSLGSLLEPEWQVDQPVTELAAEQEVSADDLPVDRVEPPVEVEAGPELTPEAEWRFEEAEAIAEVASPVEAEPSLGSLLEPEWQVDPPVTELGAEEHHSPDVEAPAQAESTVEPEWRFEEPETPAEVESPGAATVEPEPLTEPSPPGWLAEPVEIPEPSREADPGSLEPPAQDAALPEPAPAGELDEIEMRAAALLEQMAARRARASAEPMEQPSEVASNDNEAAAAWTSDSPADADELASESTEWISESPAEAVETPSVPHSEDLESPPEPAIDQPVEASSEPGKDPSPPTEVEPPREERSKGATARRPALPPWQMAGPMVTAQFEHVGSEEPVAPYAPPPPPAPAPPPQESPAAQAMPPHAPNYGPPSQPPARPRPGALPPLPPPLPPTAFPPPPWWPAPGRRVAPQAQQQPPAMRTDQQARPHPTPPQPPAGGPPPTYQPFRVPPPIEEAEIANPDRFAPPSGWRRAVHKATSGHVNPGASRKERRQEHLLAEIRQPIVGDFRIAVLSIKGGVGKTTTTFGLGSALATVRHDRVIAVDANPDRGTLGERVGDYSTRSTVRDLLSDPNINRYADVRNHTLMATSRLEVLASEQDPAVSEIFGADDYRRTVDILRHFYNIILTDCGTGIMHSAMSAILDLAHTIVLVSSPAIDAARSASATLDWLMQHGHSGLVREAHVVLSASRPGSAALKLDKVYDHFQTRCRSIHLIPFDPHLAEGADVDFGRLNPATRQAYLELAGSVAQNFGRLRPREQS
ncbi:hypothetical protein A5657_00410 [Mycobacterium kubicae]|nr:hypothetical protein A5657_00410 [Mycobacterium kubicae]